jgi:hypothetical protein
MDYHHFNDSPNSFIDILPSGSYVPVEVETPKQMKNLFEQSKHSDVVVTGTAGGDYRTLIALVGSNLHSYDEIWGQPLGSRVDKKGEEWRRIVIFANQIVHNIGYFQGTTDECIPGVDGDNCVDDQFHPGFKRSWNSETVLLHELGHFAGMMSPAHIDNPTNHFTPRYSKNNFVMANGAGRWADWITQPEGEMFMGKWEFPSIDKEKGFYGENAFPWVAYDPNF